MLSKKVEIYLGSADYQQKIEDLYLLYGDEENSFIQLNYDGCWYPGDHPSIGIYKCVELKESELIGLTSEQLRMRYTEFDIRKHVKISKQGICTGLK